MLASLRRRLPRLLGALFCLGLAAGILAFVWQPEEPVHAAPPATVTVTGSPIDLGGDLGAQAQALAFAWQRQPLRLTVDEHVIALSRGELGGRVDVARLTAQLQQAADDHSPLRREHAATRPGQPLDLPLPITFDGHALTERLVDLKDDLDQPASEAKVDTESKQVVPERVGRHLDVWATLDRVEATMRAGGTEVEAAIEHVSPSRTAAALADVSMDHVVGRFSTRYNRTEEAQDRTHNLRVGAAKINGTVLLPGDIFDFNEVVGERSQANGFRPAPVIAGGELVDGVGGGACQLAGTLHAAAYFAGLKILERHPHSRPSGYIKLGLDATVSYPQLNLRLQNTLPHPVVIEMSVAEGHVRAKIWGQDPRRMVTFVRRIDDILPFEERSNEDSHLPDGVRVLVQRGVPGFVVKTWRVVRDMERNQAVRQASVDTYPPTTQIWRVGTGGPAPEGFEPPEGDHHLEYVADHLLTMTEGPGIHGIQEQRRAGRTGTYGWTVREGMPGVE